MIIVKDKTFTLPVDLIVVQGEKGVHTLEFSIQDTVTSGASFYMMFRNSKYCSEVQPMTQVGSNWTWTLDSNFTYEAGDCTLQILAKLNDTYIWETEQVGFTIYSSVVTNMTVAKAPLLWIELINARDTAITNAEAAEESADDAEDSADSAEESASTATTKASEAATSASTATTKASEASTSAATASTQAGIATTKASEASESATTASTQAGVATTKANEASASATSAAGSASAAAEEAEDAAEYADSAEASKEAIENMTVSCETLTPGSSATVTKTEVQGVVNLHYGIPRGAGIISGGTTGQILVKKSNTDYDVEWISTPANVELQSNKITEWDDESEAGYEAKSLAHYPNEKLVRAELANKSFVSVFNSGTSTDVVKYIYVNDEEFKLCLSDTDDAALACFKRLVLNFS